MSPLRGKQPDSSIERIQFLRLRRENTFTRRRNEEISEEASRKRSPRG
jgi:hypothetical protein